MKVYLREISEYPIELQFSENETWVKKILNQLNENTSPEKQKNCTQIKLNIQKVDDVFVITGKIDTLLSLSCSRCLDSFVHHCKPKFTSLYCKNSEMVNPRSKGQAKSAHEPPNSNDQFSDIDITYLEENYINLSDLVTEQLQLQVPFQPLCNKNCKGLCTHCGTNFNLGKCACEKIITKKPFATLSNLKNLSKTENKNELQR